MPSIRTKFLFLLLILLMLACGHSADKIDQAKPLPDRPKRVRPVKISYHFEKGKVWKKKIDSIHGKQLHLLLSINRVDRDNLPLLDSVLVTDDYNGDIAYYLPFPIEVRAFSDISKIILFSYPLQAFGAYEYGDLIYTGATNMGRKKNLTPTGLFFTNWKAEETTSTFNDEWNLKWNFNIENKEGIGWHEYAMPGYPASHSCLRLLEEDAKFLYTWADEWTIKGANNVLAQGTPVVVFGSYDFGGRRPWRELANDSKAVDLSGRQIKEITAPFMERIAEQQKRTDEVQELNKK